ncbi:MAG: response regulator [Asticcacaulis sp.]
MVLIEDGSGRSGVRQPPNILVVDDTAQIRILLGDVLSRAGFQVTTAGGGAQMDEILERTPVDLVVLDSVMPGEDGLSICKRLSEQGGPPIIMLSAKGEDLDRIRGLERGAEDYMAKPFNPNELIARIRIVLRRQAKSAVTDASRPLTFSGWTFETATRRLSGPGGAVLILSAAESAFLQVLLTAPGRPLKRSHILAGMGTQKSHSTPAALDTLVSRLRRKMSDIEPETADAGDIIRTVYGVGYMLQPRPDAVS